MSTDALLYSFTALLSLMTGVGIAAGVTYGRDRHRSRSRSRDRSRFQGREELTGGSINKPEYLHRMERRKQRREQRRKERWNRKHLSHKHPRHKHPSSAYNLSGIDEIKQLSAAYKDLKDNRSSSNINPNLNSGDSKTPEPRQMLDSRQTPELLQTPEPRQMPE